MKKFIILFLALMLIISGCFHKQPTKSTGDRKTQPKEGPLIIGKKIKKKVKVFFTNQKKEEQAYKKYDPEDARAYQFAFSLQRTIDTTTTTVAQDTINALIKGPTDDEKAKGFGTEIRNIKLDSVVIKNKTATAKFSGEDFHLEGDMSGPRLRAQIEKTLLQFPDVKKVIIYINGKTNFDSLEG